MLEGEVNGFRILHALVMDGGGSCAHKMTPSAANLLFFLNSAVKTAPFWNTRHRRFDNVEGAMDDARGL